VTLPLGADPVTYALTSASGPVLALGAHFATEPLAGGLPGHAQGGGYPVPASPVRPGLRNALGEQRLIPPGTFGGLGDCAQVGEVFHVCRSRIEFIGAARSGPAPRPAQLRTCLPAAQPGRSEILVPL
jgi:hypothetical protein